LTLGAALQHLRFKDVHGRLHCLGSRKQIGQEHFAAAKLLAGERDPRCKSLIHRFEPSDCTSPDTLLFNPFTTDEMVITVITPMTMPRMVSPLRSLFARSVFSAIATVSFRSPLRIVLVGSC